MTKSHQEKVVSELEELFDYVPPSSLRKSMTQVFFHFLSNIKSLSPENLETISSDFYFLLKFLDEMEEIYCSKQKIK